MAILSTYSIGLFYFDSHPSEHGVIHLPASHACRSKYRVKRKTKEKKNTRKKKGNAHRNKKL